MRVGSIGLGIMGNRMAANLQKQGLELVGQNRTRIKAEDLVEKGAEWADTPAAVARKTETVCTILAHPDAVRETALGMEGLLGALKPNAPLVECSTVHPSFTREMAGEAHKRNVRFLDAPVAGSKNQAAAYEAGAPMPVPGLVKEIYRLAMRSGFGQKDFLSLYSFLNT